jgi:hypothetical protein
VRLLALALAFAALAVWLARRDRAVPARDDWQEPMTWNATNEAWGSW